MTDQSESIDTSTFPLTQDYQLAELLTRKSSSHLSLASLLELQRKVMGSHPQGPEMHQALAESFLKLGEPLIAYDVLAEGRKSFPNNLKLNQLFALALARSGATMASNSLLLQLVQAGQQDEETLGLLARTHKDLWLQATTQEVGNLQLQAAFERYLQAYQLTSSLWTGINAATLAIAMGQSEQAKAIAQKVRERCLQKLPANPGTDDYWTLATLGETALLLGEWAEAESWYGQAIALGQGRLGDLSSTQRNALLLATYLKIDEAQIKRWFAMPRVVVFCGHMIDHPSRSEPRFPPHLEHQVYRTIRDRLQQLDARLGYASAACGSDILFLEAIRELKGEMHIVLPYDQAEFIQESVDIIPESNWKERFEQLIQQATEVITTSNQKLQENNVVYEYSNRFLHGMAKMRSAQLLTDLISMAVWNGKPGDGIGGTAGTIALWQQWGDAIEVINLASLLQSNPVCLPASPPPLTSSPIPIPPSPHPSILSSPPTSPSPTTPPLEQEIRALLFADVVNYSQLREDQYPAFTHHFLHAIAGLTEQPPYQPLLKSTWGDAFYFVFSTVAEAGQFALEMCDLVEQINWQEKGLPEGLNLRIALHAGPVARTIEPITKQVNYIGTHVTRTARIEPVTPPGKVYASQEFAAIAASEKLKDFTCDYVGQMPWAKRYGTFPTYHVHRPQ